MKHSTKYLYDLEPVQLIGLPYEQALALKADSGKALLSRLIQPPHMEWDRPRVESVQKAIKFNRDLLEELQC